MSIITPVSAYKPLASHRFMKSMASGGLARFIMLEAFVEAGRTYQAYRRIRPPFFHLGFSPTASKTGKTRTVQVILVTLLKKKWYVNDE